MHVHIASSDNIGKMKTLYVFFSRHLKSLRNFKMMMAIDMSTRVGVPVCVMDMLFANKAGLLTLLTKR